MSKTSAAGYSMIIGACLLRLIFSAFFYHPDLKSQHFHGQFLSRGVLNIYDFLDRSRTSLPYSDTFNYPPLTYLFLGSWQAVASVYTGSGLTSWLNDWSDRHLFTPDLFTYLLILKFPYFITDVCLLLLLLLLSAPSKRFLLSLLWLFNPVSLYAVYAIGQFDILPAVLTVAAAYLAIKNRLSLAVICLSLGAGFKIYPLLLIPFILLRSASWKNLITSGLAGLAVWLLPLLPFIAGSAFRQIIFGSSLSGRILNPYFAVFYLIILWFSWRRHRNPDVTWEFMAVTLGVLLFARFHAQWILWTLPFMFLRLVRRPRLGWGIAVCLVCAMGIIFLLPDQFVLTGLFSPLNPYLTTIPALSSFLPVVPQMNLLLRGLLIGSGLWLVKSDQS